jgi:V8-like Glu-specific endopeptidase
MSASLWISSERDAPGEKTVTDDSLLHRSAFDSGESEALAVHATSLETSEALAMSSIPVAFEGTSAGAAELEGNSLTLGLEVLRDAVHGSYNVNTEASITAEADTALMKAIVQDTTVYPFRTICFLEIHDKQGVRWRGTGALVAERLLVTAGHNVFFQKQRDWAAKVRVVPARNGTLAPYGLYDARRIVSVDGWVKGGDPDYDYGAIFLHERIGASLGWFGLHQATTLELTQSAVKVAGYPNASGTQIGGTGRVNTGMVNPFRLYYTVPTAAGQSGAPIWLEDRPMISAVHAYRSGPLNSGVRISGLVQANIERWKAMATELGGT